MDDDEPLLSIWMTNEYISRFKTHKHFYYSNGHPWMPVIDGNLKIAKNS